MLSDCHCWVNWASNMNMTIDHMLGHAVEAPNLTATESRKVFLRRGLIKRGVTQRGYSHLLASTLSLRAAGPATILSHRCNIPFLLKDDHIARHNQLPVRTCGRCDVVLSSRSPHKCRFKLALFLLSQDSQHHTISEQPITVKIRKVAKHKNLVL